MRHRNPVSPFHYFLRLIEYDLASAGAQPLRNKGRSANLER